MIKYALIGGRSISNLYNPCLEEKIFESLNINNPNILFFPFACINDMEKSCNKFIKLMESVSCNIECICDIEDINKVATLIKWADVLYFGGGHSEDLISAMKKINLKSFDLDNKLLCGISAGSIMLSKSGMGDKYIYANNNHLYNYKMVDGLNFLDITVCPHYDHDGLLVYNDDVKNYNCSGFGIEDDTAIIIYNNKVIPVKQDLSKSIYYFNKENNYELISLYKELEM